MKIYEKIDNNTVRIIDTTTEEKEISLDALFGALDVYRDRYNSQVDELNEIKSATDIDFGERVIPKKI